MKFKQYLQEEYFASHYGTEIVVNPSMIQVKKMESNSQYKRIRFAVNFVTKKIFIWDASDYVHIDIVARNGPLKDEFDSDIDQPQFYMGNGRIKDNVIIHSSDSFNFNNTKKVKSYLSKVDDEWTKYYFGERLSIQLLKAFELVNLDRPLYNHSAYKDKIIPGDVYKSEILRKKAIK